MDDVVCWIVVVHLHQGCGQQVEKDHEDDVVDIVGDDDDVDGVQEFSPNENWGVTPPLLPLNLKIGRNEEKNLKSKKIKRKTRKKIKIRKANCLTT